LRARAAEYELVSPGSLAGVLALMSSEPGGWMPIAGGTELMVQFGAGRLRAKRLVNIFGLAELGGIREEAGGVWIGAGTTYTALRRSSVIAGNFPLLARAASWTGSIANQNRGTLGGNLVNGSPAADSPPALLAYEAELDLVSVRGTRRVPYREFHTGYKTSVLAADELVLGVRLTWLGSGGSNPTSGAKSPKPGHPKFVQYLRKVGPRNAMAISKVALGAVGRVVEGRLDGVRIGLASVSHAPFRCVATEAYLNARAPGDVAGARACLLGEIAPLDDVRSTGSYRAHVAGNLLEEFLGQLAGKGGSDVA
jgi:CO/xanthine dehydrogenase FAD-binding subunit